MTWKQIPEYPKYIVSDTGLVRSTQRKNEVFKNLFPTKKGYLRVCLVNETTTKHFMVHRVVALAFLDNPKNLPVVNHKDGNKQNNHVGNLEWCTDGENQLHAYAIGLRKQHQGEKHIYAGGGVTYNDLAASWGISKSMIGYIVTKHNWTHV